MNIMLNTITVRNKLNILIVIVFVAVLVVTIDNAVMTSKIDQGTNERYRLKQIDNGILQLRRNEKDFLARNDLNYLGKFEKNHSILMEEINSLSANLQKMGIDNSNAIALGEIMAEYKNAFVSLVNAQKKIGMNHRDGLYGALRQAVHNAETAIKEQHDYKLLSDMLMLRRREKDFMLRGEEKYVGKFNKDYTILERHISESNISPEVKESVSGYMSKYKTGFLALVQGYKEKGLDEKSGMRGYMRSTVHKTEILLKDLDSHVENELENRIHFFENISYAISGIMAAVIILLIYLLSHSIIKPVEKLRNAMNTASKNKDLSVQVDIKGQDEIASMATVYNTMLQEFNKLIGHVKESVESLSVNAAELASVTQQTSNGVLQQQNESDQVATAINEMSATVQEVARSAEGAAVASQHADEESQKGRAIVKQASDGIMELAREVEHTANVIRELEKESKNIGSVVNVIDEIAEQTNLLALNAAIEAARAGESGRGFAVVADEVRSLAQRSQNSTKEIKEIIERLQNSTGKAVTAMDAGQEKAQHTVERAKETGVSLDAITSAISTIREMNTQIASAAEEQAAVAEEVNRSIVNITQIASETSQGAGKTTATSNDLSLMAMQLQDIISQFKSN